VRKGTVCEQLLCVNHVVVTGAGAMPRPRENARETSRNTYLSRYTFHVLTSHQSWKTMGDFAKPLLMMEDDQCAWARSKGGSAKLVAVPVAYLHFVIIAGKRVRSRAQVCVWTGEAGYTIGE
jgi:hypothetical protein